MKFKVGDRVRCISNDSGGVGTDPWSVVPILTRENIYIIKGAYIGSDGDSYVNVSEVGSDYNIGGGWYESRFKAYVPNLDEIIYEIRIKAGDKVRCIDSECASFLQEGKVYTVRRVIWPGGLSIMEESPDHKGNDNFYMFSRFKKEI